MSDLDLSVSIIKQIKGVSNPDVVQWLAKYALNLVICPFSLATYCILILELRLLAFSFILFLNSSYSFRYRSGRGTHFFHLVE